MAIFDKDDFRRINEHLEKIGYPAEYFNVQKEQVFTNDEQYKDSGNTYYEYNENPFLNGFYVEPLIVEGIEFGDKWKIYYVRVSQYSWRKPSKDALLSLKVEKVNGQNVLIAEDEATAVIIEQTKKGGRYVSETQEYIDAEELATKSEFASFDNFESVDAPDYSVLFGENPQVSMASKQIDVQSITDAQFKKAQEKLERSQKELDETLQAQNEGVLSTAMWTFDEVDELYNKQITTDDKRAFLIWLQNKNKKQLTGDFVNKYGTSYPSPATDILELMKKGCLFFDPTAKFGERLQPKVIYQSGNIWKKRASLQEKKDYYVQRFGEEIYNIHNEAMEDIFADVWENRLRVSGNDKSMLATILPISDIARTLKITQVVNPRDRAVIEENFRIYTSWKKGERVEDISGAQSDGNSRNNYINKKSLSLSDGFLRWCAMAGSGKQAQDVGVQWSAITTSVKELEDYYIKPKRNPFTSEKNGAEKWARYQDDARKVGTRLFAQFLSEGLVPTDQTKVEVIFNSTFNDYFEPKLEQVPIGFTYKKYLDNRHLFILSKSNLNALRYYLTRGSVGLAYGVGLGKTFCSIFVMKQALDLGIAKRPLVIVPNQVYFQFGTEIQRGLGQTFDPKLPNTRLNMFYNASGIYNALGNNAVDGINLCTYEATETFAFSEKDLTDRVWLEDAINILEMGSEDTKQPQIVEAFFKEHSTSIFKIDVDTDSSEVLDEEDLSKEIEQMSETMTRIEEQTDDDLDLGDFKRGGGVEKEELKNSNEKPKKNEVVYLNIESTNFDFVCVDEAHNFNNLFSSVVSRPKETQNPTPDAKTGKFKIKRDDNPYSKIRETAGGKDASARAEKLWWLSKYVQSKSPMGNTLLLSATPFTNSPLQLFTMLAYLNYDMLLEAEVGILKDFFDLFAKIEYAEDFKTDLSIVKRNKLIGWNNVVAMQKMVYRVFDKSSREEEDQAVIRPNKVTLPLKRMLVNGMVYEFSKENFVSTTIALSNKQKELWQRVRDYAGGVQNPTTGKPVTYAEVCNADTINTTSFGAYTKVNKDLKRLISKYAKPEDSVNDGTEVDVEDADDLADGSADGDKAKESAKALQCLMWGRQICLNPYLFKCSGYTNEPTAKDYVEASPKLLYVMNCIQSVKEYHAQSEVSPYMSGQVIYMNFGVDAFTLIRDYLVEVLGFDINEIGIISGKGNYIGKKLYDNKQRVADAFLGRILNAETGKYSQLEESKRVKVLIGSEAIKEGINLQDYASVLYNCFLDFNPTDMVQVEGRIWRQGNAFANVRIVTPLMADCIDVFMFQKLEDKTERINQIWTRNGQLNELDTTAFNPAELKYELLTDPVAIARLEVEYKKEKIDEQIVAESEILSRYVGLLDTWNNGEKVLYPKIMNYPRRDIRVYMYYNICQIRPDLIDRKLINFEEWDKFLRLVETDIKSGKTRYTYSFSELKQQFPNPNTWVANSTRIYGYETNEWKNWENVQDVKDIRYVEWVNKIYNYSMEDLIGFYTTFFKDQKIGYPRGYASNWRDLIPKKQVPIVEGDEVEFDTKKGRKKGIAELVVSSNGQLVLSNFFYHLMYQYRNNETDKKVIDEAIKELKLKLVNFDKEDFDELDDKAKKEWALLLKYMYKNNPNYIMGTDNWYDSLIPIALDVDELEDLNIKDKNIVRVAKKDEGEKEVKPNKYPDPIVFTNKDIENQLKEMAGYVQNIYIPKMPESYTIEEFLESEVENQLPVLTEYFLDGVNLVLNDYTRKENYKVDDLSWSNLPKTWIELEQNQKGDTWSMTQCYGTRMYDFDMARKVADFNTAKKKQYEPMGITKRVDLEELVNEQKTKINGFDVEKKNLDDKQVFEEIVQEVRRRQQELASEEIRAGSSYVARALSFATPNSDYLGNELLSIFQNTDEEVLASIDVKYRPSERAIADARRKREMAEKMAGDKKETPQKPKVKEIVVEEPKVEEVVVDEKQNTMLLIADLEESLQWLDETEKQTTQELINELREALMWM